MAASGVSVAQVAQRIDITLSAGRRIVVEGPTALSAVVGLVQGLMT
ncbi:oxidoreductase [Leisingera sp. ANG59]|nr:oxidoreductase [Leisingera sp. ANG59]